MNKPLKQILYWAPRIVGILFILFLSMFALDVFGTGSSWWETLLALFLHLIPSIVLTIAVLIAWKQEWFGVALFLGWAIFYAFMAARDLEWVSLLVISGLPTLIGLLFLAGWVWRKQIRGS